MDVPRSLTENEVSKVRMEVEQRSRTHRPFTLRDLLVYGGVKERMKPSEFDRSNGQAAIVSSDTVTWLAAHISLTIAGSLSLSSPLGLERREGIHPNIEERTARNSLFRTVWCSDGKGETD